MIEPTKKDIGREVCYICHDGKEFGIIIAFNDKYVFVRYHQDIQSKATHRNNLFWIHDDVNRS